MNQWYNLLWHLHINFQNSAPEGQLYQKPKRDFKYIEVVGGYLVQLKKLIKTIYVVLTLKSNLRKTIMREYLGT